MEAQADLAMPMGVEENAAKALGNLLNQYQADRTPENRKAYLRALKEFSELVTDRR